MPAQPLTSMDPLRPLLARSSLGLFSDIDGTLSPIVPRPEDARVTRRCRTLLRRLIAQGVRVAIITGRPLAIARSMLGLDGAAYAASHGLEFWLDGTRETVEGLDEYPSLVEQLIAETRDLAAAGVELERKQFGLALHYRRSPDAEAARKAILRALGSCAAAQRFDELEGRKVIELRPPVDADKGTATRRLAERLGIKSIICLGDDRTDVAMFRAAGALRERGIEARSVAVLSPEAAGELLEPADFTVDGVPGVEWLLAQLVTVLDERPRSDRRTGARARK